MFASSPLRRENGSLSPSDLMLRIMIEKNGRTLDYFPGEVSTDRITAIQVLCHLYFYVSVALGISTFITFILLILHRKPTGVWHLRFLKLMELTTPILKRFKFQ